MPTRRLRIDTDNKQRLDFLGVRLVLQSLARGHCIYPLDHNVEQNPRDREHNLALRGGPRSLSFLLYLELGLPLLCRRFLLLDSDPLRTAPDRSLR